MKKITHKGFIALYPNGQPCIKTYGFQRFITEAMLITTTKEPLEKLQKEGFTIVECERTFTVADLNDCGIDPVEDRKQDKLAEARECLEEMNAGRDK